MGSVSQRLLLGSAARGLPHTPEGWPPHLSLGLGSSSMLSTLVSLRL